MGRHLIPARPVVVLIALVLVSAGLSQTEGSQSQEEIRKKHLVALGSKDLRLYRRAVQRLSAQRNEKPEDWRPLLKVIVSPPSPAFELAEMDAAPGLARVGPDVLPDVLAELKKWSGHDASGWGLLLCIGRMGPQAVKATPYLLDRLAAEETHQTTKAIIRVVLANVGYESQDNLDAILTSIRGPGSEGSTVSTMALTGSREWVTPAMVLALANRLETSRDEYHVAVALGVLKERAAPATAALERSMATSLNARGYSSGYIACGFALAQVAPERRREVLRSVFAKLGPYGIQNHTDWTFIYLVTSPIGAAHH